MFNQDIKIPEERGAGPQARPNDRTKIIRSAQVRKVGREEIARRKNSIERISVRQRREEKEKPRILLGVTGPGAGVRGKIGPVNSFYASLRNRLHVPAAKKHSRAKSDLNSEND